MSRGERLLIGFFLALAVAATVLALDFKQPESQMFPLFAGAGTTLIIVGYFVISSNDWLSERMRPYIVDDLFMKIDSGQAQGETEGETRTRLTRERQLISMFGGFGLVAWLVGLTFAVPAFLVYSMRKFSGESWKTTVTVTAGTCAFLYVMFIAILKLKLHFGLLGGL